MKTKLRRACQTQARNECANYYAGFCVHADKPCEAAPKAGGICRWFREAVLPANLDLMKEVSQFFESMTAEKRKWNLCADCNRPFFPEKQRQIFCPECKKRRRQEQTRKAVRDLRQRVKEDM
ncbi:MAG: cysteine-rich VLP protein [Clostridia bacterium]|nr:cysteine-rich VLP protein [Clostridia bacterium]